MAMLCTPIEPLVVMMASRGSVFFQYQSKVKLILSPQKVMSVPMSVLTVSCHPSPGLPSSLSVTPVPKILLDELNI